MRSIKELLEIMLTNVECIGLPSKTAPKLYGLCYLTSFLAFKGIITTTEWGVLYEYLADYLPKNELVKDTGYCWPKGQVEPRKAWLLEQIKIINLASYVKS